MEDAIIEARNLTKVYETPNRQLEVLKGIDLRIGKGEFVTLIGPSGSGKTTFLNMITGIDRPTGGEVVVNGVNITQTKERKLVKWRARNIGLVFQFSQLLPTLSVVDNVIAPMDFAGVWQPRERREKAMALLDRLGIADQADKTPDMLSGGQQQRVGVARALANDPALIVGDEPTGSLDHMSAANVFDIFREYALRGSTVLIVTPDRKVAQGMDNVLGLYDGEIQQTTLEEVAARRTQQLQALRTGEVKKLSTQELKALQS